jgi:hypothetical protein
VVDISENKIALFGGGGAEHNRYKDIYFAEFLPEHHLGINYRRREE